MTWGSNYEGKFGNRATQGSSVVKNSDSEAAAINNISYLVDGKEIYSDASLYIVEAGAEIEAYTSNGTSVLTTLGNHVRFG